MSWACGASAAGRIYDHPNLIRAASVIGLSLALGDLRPPHRSDTFHLPDGGRRGILATVSSGELVHQLLVSLSALAAGFGASLVLGVILGLLWARSRLAEAILEPHVNALYATPQVALTPLLMMWLGLGFAVKVAVVFLFAFFPILINTASGAKNVSASMVEVGRAYLAPPRQILFKIVFPAALPFIMAGIRIAIGRGLVGMIVAELFTAITGLGAMLSLYGKFSKPPRCSS